MESRESIPAAFTLALADKELRLPLPGPPADHDSGWVRIDGLRLDGSPGEPDRLVSGGDAAPEGAGDAAPRESVDRLKTRRLIFRAATLATDPAQLQAALDRCALGDSGFERLRVWFGSDTPWIGGRVTIGNREAPFTIRVAVEPRATGARRIRIFLGDVRLFAPLPVPAPLIGASLARAILGACHGGAAHVGAGGGAIDVAPLELALVSALVAWGWRLPDLTAATLESAYTRAGELRLAFASGRGPSASIPSPPLEERVIPGSWLEGERLADTLAGAEAKLFAGDVRAAEMAYRQEVAARPDDRAAHARLVAVCAATASPELASRARDLTMRWPDFVPGWLFAAIGAWGADDRASAVSCFAQAAELAAQRGESEDARLAREAADALRARAHTASPPPAEAGAAIPAPLDRTESGGVTGRTKALYATEADPGARAGALGELLRGFDRLPLERQRAAYASFGRVAESTGDLDRAEEAYWRGTHVEGQPAERADFLVAHARLLLSRGNDRAAGADLDEALRIAPDHVRAMVARADLAFRAREWESARDLYARLDRADVAEWILRETLVHRRAVLARAAGDVVEAEACYRELAILDPLQAEARQALAEIASARGELTTAAQRWEEVLRLLPLGAIDRMLDVRQRLADVYASVGDWGAARTCAELILRQDGLRLAALERAVEAYTHLGLFEEAAASCERLSRLYSQPARRAEVLYHQGEIFRDRLGDERRAFDAFLKSSDLDPTFAPTALRLVQGFWSRGQFEDVAELADELGRTGALCDAPLTVRLRLAMGGALAGRDPALVHASVDTKAAATDPGAVAEAVAEAALRLSTAPLLDLGAAVSVLRAQRPTDDNSDLRGAVGAELTAMLRDDPVAVGGGAAYALAWFADRRGELASARALYAIGTFLDGNDGGVLLRLGELSLCPVPTADSLRLCGPCDDPRLSGAAAPLRRALGALAHGLAGFGPLGGRAASSTGALGLAALRRELLHAVAKTMGAPPFDLALADPMPPFPDVTVRATRPATITIAATILEVSDEELTFSVAHAVDRLRGGLALIEAATFGKAEDVAALLEGASAALAGRAPPESPLAVAAATELASPDRAAALVGQASRAVVASDLEGGKALLCDWTSFREAAELAADRFAIVACRSPVAALRALYRQHIANAPGATVPPGREHRIEFLRTARMRALLAFMTSAAYLDAARDTDRA